MGVIIIYWCTDISVPYLLMHIYYNVILCHWLIQKLWTCPTYSLIPPPCFPHLYISSVAISSPIPTFSLHIQSLVHSLNEEVPKDSENEMGTPSPVCSAKDKALLLALALKWRKESKTQTISLEQLRVFEREIWVQHIRAAMESTTVSIVDVIHSSRFIQQLHEPVPPSN